MTGIRFSKRSALYCRFVDAGQSYEFGQYFSETGHYETTVAAVSGAVFADLDIYMDGIDVASIKLNVSETYELNEYKFELGVCEGLHTFRIVPAEGSAPERDYFMIDFMRFERSPTVDDVG